MHQIRAETGDLRRASSATEPRQQRLELLAHGRFLARRLGRGQFHLRIPGPVLLRLRPGQMVEQPFQFPVAVGDLLLSGFPQFQTLAQGEELFLLAAAAPAFFFWIGPSQQASSWSGRRGPWRVARPILSPLTPTRSLITPWSLMFMRSRACRIFCTWLAAPML
jgi:hypothetical protein